MRIYITGNDGIALSADQLRALDHADQFTVYKRSRRDRDYPSTS